jgi:predicted transcriptional regulator
MKKTNINKTLSALDFALSELSTAEKREDEFSIDDFIQSLAAQGESVSVSSAVSRLNTLLTKGLLKKRKARMNGRMANLYSKA